VRYLYWPSQKKKEASLDKFYLTWACAGEHPPLTECCREPKTAKALVKCREGKERAAAEQGKPEPRVTELDIYGLVVQKGFRNTPDNRTANQQLTMYARNHCSKATFEFCFKNRGRLAALIDEIWATEAIPQTLPLARLSRMEALHAAAQKPCVCSGIWLSCVMGALILNKINIPELCRDIVELLTRGRSPDTPVLVLAGLQGGEGKSMLLKALLVIYLAAEVFHAPVKSNFPLVDILDSKLCFFDEWRFETDVLPWTVQCLLYDGSAVPVNRPQNIAGQVGHTKYTGTSPVFITTKLADIENLTYWGSINPKTGHPWDTDASMIARRLKTHAFRERIPKPPKGTQTCGRCFAELVLTACGQSW
jgi:hypothetical protein